MLSFAELKWKLNEIAALVATVVRNITFTDLVVRMLRAKPSWLQRKVEGVLLDITGVLYNSGQGGGEAIPGSVEAVQR